MNPRRPCWSAFTPVLLVGLLVASPAARTSRGQGAAASAQEENLLVDATHRLVPIPGSESLEVRVVPVENLPFQEAIEAKTLHKGTWPYSIQLQMPTPAAVQEGDVMLAEFWLRTVDSTSESGEAETAFCFQQRGGTFHTSVEYEAGAGHQWQKYDVPFRVTSTDRKGFAAGGAQICFRLGFHPQTIQLGGFRLVDYGATADLNSLPVTHLDYEGRDPHAAWRAQADARIQQLREGPMTIRVVDGRGKPVVGATVEISMKRHAFHFGSAVDFRYFASNSPDAARYREFIYNHFNQVTPENDLKWDVWDGGDGKHDTALQVLHQLKEKNFRIHGHCLIWPGASRVPKDVRSLLDDRGALDRRIEEHFVDILTQTRGLVNEWDVVNEPYAERDILNRYGETLVGDWFRLAHHLDPSPRLYLNDYANFQSQGDNTAHKDDLENRLTQLLQAGAPVQGIGMQGHFGSMLCPPEAVLKELDRFSKFKVPIQITEFDVDSMDAQAKTDYTRDFLIACFSHPSVDGISCWGFWEGRHWEPGAAMVRKDWTLTPWGQAWMDLVEKQWWTHVTGPTGDGGEFKTVAFFGDYEVSVRLGDKTVRDHVSFTKSSVPVSLKLSAQ